MGREEKTLGLEDDQSAAIGSHLRRSLVPARSFPVSRRFWRSLTIPNWSGCFRGRDAGCPAPPAQIRTCALTHTAPTFGSDRGPLGPPYPFGRRHGSPAQCPARALASRIPVGHQPWLQQLRSGSSPPCSLLSSLLCRCQTSSRRASSASAPCLPDAVPPIVRWDGPKTSQVPAWGVRACLGSQTPRSPTAPRHYGAPDVAFDHKKSLGTSNHIIFVAQYPAHTRRYRRFTGILTDTAARLAVDRGSAHPSIWRTFTPYPSAS